MHATDGRSGARLGHRPALDGLRAIAIALVVPYHYFGNWAGIKGGWLGVNLFFVLSGFLITRLLLEEHERAGRISRVAFYRRRIARLLPACVLLFVSVLVVTRFLPLFGGAASVRFGMLTSLTYVANWAAVSHHAGALGPFAHLWSLSLEEQFYLVWPVTMIVLLRHMPAPRVGRVAAAIGIIIFLQLAVRSFVSPNELALFLSTDGQGMAFLLFGSAAALSFPLDNEFLTTPFGRWVRRFGGWAVAPLVPFVALYDYNGHLFYYRGVLAVLAVCMVVLVLTALVDCPLSRILSSRRLRWIGQRSYGIYLWHFPIMLAVSYLNARYGLHGMRGAEFLVVVLVTTAVADASYRYVERPLRRRLGPVQVISSMRSSAIRAPSAVAESTTI